MLYASCRSITLADKLYVYAKDAHLNGDEERAYVYYMRYYYVLKNIWKDPSYKSKKVCLYEYRRVRLLTIKCMYVFKCIREELSLRSPFTMHTKGSDTL